MELFLDGNLVVVERVEGVLPGKKLLARVSNYGYISGMTNGPATALERRLRSLAQSLTLELARALVSIQADTETQAGYDELAAKRTDCQLSPADQAKLESIVRANPQLGLLNAEAGLRLCPIQP